MGPKQQQEKKGKNTCARIEYKSTRSVSKEKILLRLSEHTAHCPHNSPAQNLFRIHTCVNQPANETHTQNIFNELLLVLFVCRRRQCRRICVCVFFFKIITIPTSTRTVWNFIEKPSHTRTNRIDTKRYAYNASNRSAHTFSMPKVWRR